MAKQNKTQFAVLGALSVRPMSGYDIKKALDESVSNFWNENFGHLYPVLHRLEREGLVRRQRGVVSTGARPRVVYAITPEGERALEAWLDTEPLDARPRNELLLQIFFGSRLGPEFLQKKIAAERRRLEARLAAYASIERELADFDATDEEIEVWTMTLRYGRSIAESLSRWCDECDRTLAKRASKKSRKKKPR